MNFVKILFIVFVAYAIENNNIAIVVNFVTIVVDIIIIYNIYYICVCMLYFKTN